MLNCEEPKGEKRCGIGEARLGIERGKVARMKGS